MKRVAIALLMLVILISSGTVSYAAAIEDGGNLELQYIGVFNHLEDLMEGLGWKLNMYAEVVPRNESVLDKVVMDMKVINYATGNSIHEEKFATYYDVVTDSFYAESSCTVSMPGTYYLDVTYKCYKNGSLIETITGRSKLLSI